MADSDHAPLAPSSGDRMVMCPGSRRLSALYPKEDTIESREGTAAHWAVAELLRGQRIAVGQVADNGVTLTDEMVECAELVNDYVNARCAVNAHLFAPASAPHVARFIPNREVERMVKNAVIHPENYGTPDLVETSTVALYVDDYKHGHKYVEAVGNYQLANYAALKIAELAEQGIMLPPDFQLVLTIHQPRCYHRGSPHREWRLTVAQLSPYIKRMRERYAIAMTDDAPCYATDPTICEDCPGRHACEAATAAGYSAYEHAYSSIPLQMSPAALGLELKILRRAQSQLKARVTGLEEQVKQGLRQPGGVPGWSVAFGDGRTVWDEAKAPVSMVIDTARALNLNIEKPGILTPLQAKKAGMPVELVDAWTRRNAGAAELVEDDGTLATRIFGGAA